MTRKLFPMVVLQVFKVRLDGALLVRDVPAHGKGWTGGPSKVSSDPNHSMILPGKSIIAISLTRRNRQN